MDEDESSELLLNGQPMDEVIVHEDDEKKVIEDEGVNGVRQIMKKRPGKWDFLGKRGRSRKRHSFRKVDPATFSSKHSISDSADDDSSRFEFYN